MNVSRAWLVFALVGVGGCALLATGGAVDPEQARALSRQAAALFGPLPAEATSPGNPRSEAKLRLGRMLYYEPRLSKSQEISCNSCHPLDRFGVDGEATTPGHEGQRGDRNSPTPYNAALQVAQLWDGRAADVEALAAPAVVAAILRSIPGYAPLFAAAFPGDPAPVSRENAAQAIGAFERGLLTPGAFDAFVGGELEALDAQQQRGLRRFIEIGCTTCHMGATLGGLMFQKLGRVHPYETEDPGRFQVTGNEADRFVFKVPSLRNVAQTGPWLHDGSIQTLEEGVRLMAWHQLGRELEPGQIDEIVAFLGSLTGEIDWGYVAKPDLPASGPSTPAPGSG